MRMKYRWFILSAVLFLTVICCEVGSVLAAEKTSSDIVTGMSSGKKAGTPSDAEPGPPSEADATLPQMDDIQEEGCRTQEELVEQLLDDSRDRIILSADIEWSGNREISVTREKEVAMGEYSIHVRKGSWFHVKGAVVFIGGGDTPLFVVQGGFKAGDGVEIHAIGEQAAAVEIADGTWAAENVEIYASGTNARAVRFTGSKEQTVQFCKIQAEGYGSRGIDSEGPLRVFLSMVSGEEAIYSKNRELQLFGCRLFPEAEHSEVIPVMVVPNNRLEENGICIAAGSAPSALWEKLENYESISWRFFSKEPHIDFLYTAPALWSEIPEDISRPGTWYARYSPAEIPEWFPAELYSLEVPVHVVNPDSPFIMDAEDANAAVFLRFFSPIREAEEIRVEYSADDGKSWRNSAELSDSFVTDTAANVEPLKPEQDYWFRLVVKGGFMEGVSNEILFVGDEMRKANGGGDRDNGDRNDQGETPPQGDIIPPPDRKPSGGSGTGGTTQNVEKSKERLKGREEQEETAQYITEPEETVQSIVVPAEIKTDGTEPERSMGAAVPGTGLPEIESSETEPPEELPGTESTGARPEGNAQDEMKQEGTAPDRAQTGASEEFEASAEGIRFIQRVLLPGIFLPGIILLGGSVYVCWKKRMGKH